MDKSNSGTETLNKFEDAYLTQIQQKSKKNPNKPSRSFHRCQAD